MINLVAKLSRQLLTYKNLLVNNELDLNFQNSLSYLSSCLLCNSSNYKVKLNNYNLCEYCYDLLDLYKLDNICNNCKWPISDSLTNNNICNLCIDNNINHNIIFSNMPVYINIALAYVNPISKLIHKLKYNNKNNFNLYIAYILANYLSDYIKSNYSKNNHDLPDVIIPVPIHKLRLKNRGYNQTIEIGKYLSKNLNIKLDYDLLTKFKYTQPQMNLDKSHRIINLENSFCFNKNIKYNSVAILDDVVTTGSTIITIVNMLKNLGINNIAVWAVARRF